MSFESLNNNPVKKTTENSLDIKKEEYLDLVSDFGIFVTLNASRLDQQIIKGKDSELAELYQNLRKPIINNLNYADFTSQYFNKLTDPEVSKTIISQIYNFLQYIEPRLTIFKEDSAWVKRFKDIKEKYTKIVSI